MLKYSNGLEALQEGEEATVIMLKVLPGRSKHVDRVQVLLFLFSDWRPQMSQCSAGHAADSWLRQPFFGKPSDRKSVV